MKVGIFKLDDGVLQTSYEASAPNQSMYGGPWGSSDFCVHMEVSVPLLPEYAKLVNGVVVEDTDKKITYDTTKVEAVEVRVIQKAYQDQEKGRYILAMVHAMNDKKFKDAELSQDAFLAMMDNAELKYIERLLMNGSIQTAKHFISLLDETFFSAKEKEIIIGKILK